MDALRNGNASEINRKIGIKTIPYGLKHVKQYGKDQEIDEMPRQPTNQIDRRAKNSMKSSFDS